MRLKSSVNSFKGDAQKPFDTIHAKTLQEKPNVFESLDCNVSKHKLEYPDRWKGNEFVLLS